MSPSVLRWRTNAVLRARRDALGDYHPATFAAYARAHHAWSGRIRPVAIPDEIDRGPLCSAYTVADLRSRGAAGFDNRHDRKRKQFRELVK